MRNRARIWNVVEEVVKRIDRLRKEGWFDVEPTGEEREKELVKNWIYCPRCEVVQVEGFLGKT